MELESCLWVKEKGLYKKEKTGEEVYISNFFPELREIRGMPEDTEIVLSLHIVPNREREVKFSLKKINRIDWFERCHLCIVGDDKRAKLFLKQLIQIQVAQHEGDMENVTLYRQLGWSRGVYGNPVYVFGNRCVGGERNARIDPSLKDYVIQVDEEAPEEMLDCFVDLWINAPPEAKITIIYSLTSLIRELYKEGGVPVNFVLYLLGEQQSRKTTLAELTCNLYCRDADMCFSTRTAERTSIAAAEKLITQFKDTTLILDDISITGDKKYKQKQEELVERVTRMIGNRAPKSSSTINGVYEWKPNASVVFTGEYLPCFSESTLSRMLILEIDHPVDSGWLTKFAGNSCMYSTVAYLFIEWMQMRYAKCVDTIRQNFKAYRRSRQNEVPFQERIQEHAFIMQNTYGFMRQFLTDRGYLYRISDSDLNMAHILRDILERQVEIMDEFSLKDADHDFCYALAKLYMKNELAIAEDYSGPLGYDKKSDDGFRKDKKIICFSAAKLCRIMQEYFKDTSINIRSMTKQLRNNRFLEIDRSDRSTKKVRGDRYLHVIVDAVKDYYRYLT